MTVPVQTPTITYIANGATAGPFAFPFKIMQADDLQIFLNGTRQTSGFTVTGIGNDSGGDVTFGSIPAAGTTILIKRYIPLERVLFDYQTNGDLLAKTINNDFDRIWMALQDVGYYVGNGDPATARALLLGDGDVSGSGSYRALQNKIQDLADPVNSQDAVNLRTMQQALADFVSTGGGDIVMSLLANATDPTLGVSLVGAAGRVVSSIAELRTLKKTANPAAFVLGYYAKGDGGGGSYFLDLADTTSTDNGGTVIVASDGGRWKLEAQTAPFTINVKQFGAKGDGTADDTTAFKNAIAYAATLATGGKGATVAVPMGSFILSSQIVVPSLVKLVGAGSRSTIINNSFNGIKFLFSGTLFSGMSGMRLGLGSGTSEIAIGMNTPSNAPCRWNTFKDLEIASPSLIAGQFFLQASVSGTGIITENVFQDIKTFSVHAPMALNGVEGNFFTNFSFDNFGATAVSAINSTSFANYFQGRIAGAPAAGSVAYTEAGARNILDIVVDIGASSSALQVNGVGNQIRLQRPETLTPIGTFTSTNTVIDSETLYTPGTPKGKANILANGTIQSSWGCIASAVKNATGNYTVNFNRSLTNPLVFVQMVGTGGAVLGVISSVTGTSCNIICVNSSGAGTDPAASFFIEVLADN